MCGIVGYVGPREARRCCSPDSRSSSTAATTAPASRCSTATGSTRSAPSEICSRLSTRHRRVVAGAAGYARRQSAERPEPGTGIGHTRWATHGRVDRAERPPALSTPPAASTSCVNGIIENYMELKARLSSGGPRSRSETDAEVIAHLIAEHYGGDLAEAVRAALRRAAWPLTRSCADERRRAGPARRRPQANARWSSAAATASSSSPRRSRRSCAHTRRVQYIEDGEIVVAERRRRRVLTTRRRAARARAMVEIDWDADDGREGRLRDVHAQGDPRAAATRSPTRSREPRRARRRVDLGDLGAIDDELLRRPRADRRSSPAAPRTTPA